MAVKHAGVARREAYCGRRRRATAERHTEKITVMKETKGDARVLPECQQGTMEESTWADSMDSVCEGGAVCACSDRTDAHVEHGERRNVHAHLGVRVQRSLRRTRQPLFSHCEWARRADSPVGKTGRSAHTLSTASGGTCIRQAVKWGFGIPVHTALLFTCVCIHVFIMKCKKLSASLLLSHDRRPRTWFTVAYHQGDRPLAPHRSRIGVPSPLLGLANLRLVESAPDGDAEHVLDMFKHQNCKTDPTRRALSVRRRTVHHFVLCSVLYRRRLVVGKS